MSQFIVDGNNCLKGNVSISGSKNSALPIITSTILFKCPVEISNIPDMGDVRILIQIMKDIGVKVDQLSPDTFRFDASGDIESDLSKIKGVSTIRGSQTLLGAILGRNHEVILPVLGGCPIGARPMDIHFQGMKKLGAVIENKGNRKYFKAKKLQGTHVYLDYSSVGATENLILTAMSAEGITIIENAAQEPEVVDLVYLLNQAGARISGIGSSTLQIIGKSALKRIKFSVMPDRIETGTFMLCAVMTKGKIQIEDCCVQDMSSLLFKLRDIGVKVEIRGQSSLLVEMDKRSSSFNIRTMPFPGFPTDLQSPMLSLACLAGGTSIISETVYENRFNVVPELRKMGANIMTNDKIATITGVEKMFGAEVQCPDLRGGISLVLAALAADGKSYIHRASVVDRGYQFIEKKLQRLNASIVRVEDENGYIR
ncbi:MAG: UDP-N-acetylglucosamine 1-carboxyvinyltransferase [Caldisericia bacterium]|nr:UDP-N-acetylglucosamine 1-carboxyvinyltransferase [Caldisericia bacterium]